MPSKPPFEELDYRQTPLGELILRRRTVLSLDNREVHEIILGDAFLMSSLFTEVEVALANLGLASAVESFPGESLDVVVGGLGLGFTARAALDHPAAGSLLVVDYLEPVIEWHRKGLVPLGPGLSADPRCRFVHGDFFELALSADGEGGFDPDAPGRAFHAILLDIDHSPKNLLHERHAAFYDPEGLRRLAGKLHPGGVFALWSDDPPDDDFMSSLVRVFSSCESHVVAFHNPLQERDSESTVYVARTGSES
jgi:spermidine synthase